MALYWTVLGYDFLETHFKAAILAFFYVRKLHVNTSVNKVFLDKSNIFH